MDDLYEVLGVEKDASHDEIDNAFKKAAKETHPDNGGDAEAFAAIKEAGDILRNPQKRKRYDEQGFTWQQRPDTINSMAMERIARFFINSIDASLNSEFGLKDLDLVHGANQFFNLQIKGSCEQIEQLKRQIKQYEKAIKRIKTKHKKNLIENLLTNHITTVKQNIAANEEQIKIAEKAKEILIDYVFEPESFSGLFIPRGWPTK